MKTKQFADEVIDQVGGSKLTVLGKLKKLTVVVLDSRNGGELSIDGIKVDSKKIVVEVGGRRTA